MCVCFRVALWLLDRTKDGRRLAVFTQRVRISEEIKHCSVYATSIYLWQVFVCLCIHLRAAMRFNTGSLGNATNTHRQGAMSCFVPVFVFRWVHGTAFLSLIRGHRRAFSNLWTGSSEGQQLASNALPTSH